MENIFGVMGRGGDKLVDAVDGKKSSNEPPQGSSLLNMASESRASPMPKDCYNFSPFQ